MLRLVFDTNTIVSAFFWKGKEFELFKRIENGKAQLFISKEIIDEIEIVINRSKFQEVIKIANQNTNQILQKIISVSHLVIGPRLNIVVCRDAKDNKFLECAINAKADYIVSGDMDLLSLKSYKNIKIVRTIEILKYL